MILLTSTAVAMIFWRMLQIQTTSTHAMPIGVSNLCKFHAQSRSGGQLVPSTIATQLNFKQSCNWAWKKCSNATFSRSMSSFWFAHSENNDDNDSACHAFHIKVEHGMDEATKHCIHIAIKMSPCIVSCADIPFAWVPMVAKDSSSQDVNHSHHTLAHHKSLQSLSECSCITSIKDLNVTSMCLSNKTLCKLISDSHLPSDNTKKAFILAETACNGEALLCHVKKQAEEVKLIIKCLLLFLQCKHSDAGEEAGDCFWDEEKNCPSSHITAKLKENLADAKISSADWVITGMEMLKDNEDKDNNKEEACSMRKPAWENASGWCLQSSRNNRCQPICCWSKPSPLTTHMVIMDGGNGEALASLPLVKTVLHDNWFTCHKFCIQALCSFQQLFHFLMMQKMIICILFQCCKTLGKQFCVPFEWHALFILVMWVCDPCLHWLCALTQLTFTITMIHPCHKGLMSVLCQVAGFNPHPPRSVNKESLQPAKNCAIVLIETWTCEWRLTHAFLCIIMKKQQGHEDHRPHDKQAHLRCREFVPTCQEKHPHECQNHQGQTWLNLSLQHLPIHIPCQCTCVPLPCSQLVHPNQLWWQPVHAWSHHAPTKQGLGSSWSELFQGWHDHQQQCNLPSTSPF